MTAKTTLAAVTGSFVALAAATSLTVSGAATVNASCTPSPAVSYSSGSATFVVRCTVPLPSPSTVTVTASPSTSATPTSSPSVSPSPSATSVPATIPATFPGPTNTGYKNASCPNGLTKFTGTIVSGGVYKCVDFAGGASVGTRDNPVSNVSFYGSRFHGTNVGGALVLLYGDNISFDFSSFEPDTTIPVAYNSSYQYGLEADGAYYSHVAQLTVTNSDFWGFGNAVDINGSTLAKPQVFRNNWIHDAANDGGGQYHTDGIGSLSGNGSGSGVVIDHNTIQSAGNTNGIAFQQGVYDHYTISNNLLGGFGYTVAVWPGSTYITFTGNTYTGGAVYGPLYSSAFATATGSVWSGNVLADGSPWNP